MKKTTLLIFSLLCMAVSWQGYAQISAYYTFSESTSTYTEITGAAIATGATGDDGEEQNVPIGFSIDYAGTAYTTLTIGVNGGLSLTNGNVDFTNNLDGTDADQIDMIAPLWDDHFFRTADLAEISYLTSGMAPNRVFTVQWKNISWRATGNTVNFQAVLFETSNNIQFNYGGITSTENRTASIGLNRGNTGSDFISVTPGTPSTASTTTADDGISSADYPGNDAVYLFTYSAPTCIAPTNLNATMLTGTSADLSWTANSAATTFDIEHGIAGFTPTGTPTIAATTNPHPLTGLTSNTGYDFYVRGICGPGDLSVWAGPFSFTTPCATFTAPYIDDVEVHTPTTNLGLSNCWSVTSVSGFDWNVDGAASTPSGGTGPSGAFSGSNYFYTEASSGGAGDLAELISPSIDVSGLTTPALEFYYHMFDDNTGQMGNLFIDAFDGSVWIPVDSILNQQQTAQADPWLKRIVNLGTFSGVIQVRFRAFRGSGFRSDISLDDIGLVEAPTCFDPTNLTATNVTFNSADLSWNDPIAAIWDIEHGITGFTPTGTPTVAGTTNPHPLTGLSPVTSYDYYVRADCGPLDGVSNWVGPFTFTTTVTCPAPSALSATNITTTSADLAWTSNSTAAAFDIEHGLAGFTPTGTATIAATTNPHPLTGLTANTTYDFYVRGICGAGDTSLWTGPIAFTTAAVAPWTEDFDNATSIPAGWNQGAANNESWLFGTSGGHVGNAGTIGGATTSGVNFAWVDDSSPHNTATTLESPFVDISALTVPTLAFYLISNNEGNSNVDFSMDVWDGAAWNVGFYASNTNTFNGEWERIVLDLSTLTVTGAVQLRFIIDENNGTDFYDDVAIDDVQLIEATCLAPDTLAAVNITETTVDLAWTEMGTATAWDIEWGPNGFVQGAGTVVTGATTNPFALTGLVGNTDYCFFVRADCGAPDGTSSWSGPFCFTTGCPAIATAPWIEDFESGGALPNCWSQGLANGEPWLFGTTGGHVGNNGTISGTTISGNGLAWVDDSTPDNLGTTLESPLVDVSALLDPALYFYLLSDNEGSVNVDFSVDVWDGAAWNVGFYTHNTNTFNNSWEQIVLSLSSLTITGPVQLRFIVDESTAVVFRDDVAIDDVELKEAPACFAPSALTANSITPTSASLSWIENGTATAWDIEYDSTGFVQGTGTVVNGVLNPHSLTGLAPSTTYDYYVRADCGGASSVWIGPFTFTTACPAFTAPWSDDFENGGTIPLCWAQGTSNGEPWLFGTTGGHVGNAGTIGGTTTSGANFAWVDDSTPDNMGTSLESPFVDVTALAVPTLYFYLVSNNEGGSNVDFSVDVWDGAAWNVGFYSSNSNTFNGEWEQIIVNLSGLTITGPVQLRFVVDEAPTGAFTDDVAIDDVEINEGPACFDPLSLTASNVTTTSADLGWTENGSATTWDVEWGPFGFTQGSGTLVTGTTTNPHALTGLTSGTEYCFFVRADCGTVNGTSNWTGPFCFTTEADYCAGDNFYDGGGANNDYASGVNDTTIICPTTAGDVVSAIFNSFDTEAGFDSLFVYDGNGTAGTFLGGFDGNTIPGPFISTDASGCLTFVFISDGGVVAAGWDASITCGPAPTCVVDLGLDTLICEDDSLILDAGAGSSYLWSTGELTQTITLDTTSLGGNGVYTIGVTVVDSLGCSATDTIVVTFDICSSIDEPGKVINFNLFPNPNKGIFTLNLNTSDAKELDVKVMNIQGQVVFSKNKFENTSRVNEQINLSGNAKGIYFITVTSENGTTTKKVVIQ